MSGNAQNFISPTPNQLIICNSGNQYTSSATGIISVPGANSATNDVTDLLHAGCIALGFSSQNYYLRKTGTVVANGTSNVSVADTGNAITDVIQFTLNTVGGTVGAIPHVSTITVATGFTVAASASDTSTYNYAIWSVGPT